MDVAREVALSQVVTGEAVALDLRPAGLPSRMVAALVDGAALLGLFLVLGTLAAAVQLDLDEAAGAAVALVVVVLVLVGYPVLFETLLRGRTPGKMALGLRVVRDDGGPIGFRHALVRGLAAGVLERPGPLLFLPAIVCMLLNRSGKRIGDVLAGTFVLRERVAGRTPALPPVPPQLAGWATTLDLSRLPDDLALAARQFTGRAHQLTPSAREEVGGRLVAAVAAVVTPPPPPGVPGWAYLTAVLGERRRREELRLQTQPGGAWPAAAPAPGSTPPAGSPLAYPPPSGSAPPGPHPGYPPPPGASGPVPDRGPGPPGTFTAPS